MTNDYQQIINDVNRIRKEAEILTSLSESRLYFRKSSDIDKFGIGFNLDSRFSTSGEFKVTLDAWKGYYGDSGCCTSFDFEPERFRRVFIDVINENAEYIFAKMAKKYLEIGKQKVDDIDKQIKLLQDLKAEVEKEEKK